MTQTTIIEFNKTVSHILIESMLIPGGAFLNNFIPPPVSVGSTKFKHGVLTISRFFSNISSNMFLTCNEQFEGCKIKNVKLKRYDFLTRKAKYVDKSIGEVD